MMNLEPSAGMAVKLSVAVHDVDMDRSEGKLQWFFRNEEDFERFNLGEVILGAENSISSAGSHPSGDEKDTGDPS